MSKGVSDLENLIKKDLREIKRNKTDEKQIVYLIIKKPTTTLY